MWVVLVMWSSNYIIARSADGVVAPHMLANGALLGWAILGEVPGSYCAVGAALILPSIALSARA